MPIKARLYKEFDWLELSDSGQSGMTLQLFQTIVTSYLIGKNHPINQSKFFIQLDVVCKPMFLYVIKVSVVQHKTVFITTQVAQIK